MANLLSIAITGIAQLIYSAHILKVRITDVFPWMRILLILGINTIIALLLSICLKFANLDLGIHGIIVAVSLSLAWIAIFSLFYKNRVKYLWHSINLA
ncbi:hypothetical protein AGMMS49992_18910 [Clostridia bacterium]|nr:hypothetical protein AGMMS49992_18910 [Clostridia bacterium]